MRVRLATLLALILVAVPVTTILGASAAGAGTGGKVVLAQEGDETDEPEGGKSPGEAEKDADAEVGADEGEEAPPVEEEGPVWTYQMAWIVIGMLIFMLLGVALAYKKLVVDRQRAGV